MKKAVDCLRAIKGNEELLEKFIEAINNGTCKVHKDYPNPFLLNSGELFYSKAVLDYFFETRPFSKELYFNFFEKARKLIGFSKGATGTSYAIQKWIEERITKKFYDIEVDKWGVIKSKIIKQNVALSDEDKEILSFICYAAICHIKYGASYERVTANSYFDMVTELGSDEVVQLKKNGSGNIPKEILEYKDTDISCKANDVFATIKITIKSESEQLYEKVLDYLCTLLGTEFPNSYAVDFLSPQKDYLPKKDYLPIKKLPKKGINQLFANAVKFPGLHSKIECYARLAMKEYEWYNNLEGEHCAMPGTFAVFALGLFDESYFQLVSDYLAICDGEHQSVQGEFVLAYIEKYGFTEKGLKLYQLCENNIQELPSKLINLYKKQT